MKIKGLIILIAMISMVFPSCTEKRTEPTDGLPDRVPFTDIIRIEREPDFSEWKKPQSDRTLTIAVEHPFDTVLNPFAEYTPSSGYILSQVFSAPLHRDGTPWAGTIETETHEDGSLTATVRIRENMLFSDGEPVIIDDYIYGFYVAGDPTMTPPLVKEMTGIEGMNEYRYDEPEWESMMERSRRRAELTCSPDEITQEDYERYLMESELEGKYTDTDPGDWKTYIKNEGFEAEWNNIDNTDRDAVLELLATVEVANHHLEWDPVGWWTGAFVLEEMMKDLGDGTKVTGISGIEKIDDHTCTIRFRSAEDFSLSKINKPFIPEHWYGIYHKGSLEEVLSKAIPLGSGPYRITSLSSERVKLEANPLYFEGTPVIGSIEMVHSPQQWDMVPYPTRDEIEALFTKESLDIHLPEGTDFAPVLWKLRLK